MRRPVLAVLAVAVLALPWLAGCPGDGSALSRCGDGILDPLEECDDGNTMDGDGCDASCLDESGLRPTLTSIHANIFLPSCSSGCHEPGGIAPMALDTPDAAFMNLVNATSVELPPLLRVKPFDPEQSYLIWKLEGRATIVGDQMPLFGTPLSQDEIDVIAQWITDGAKP